MIPSINLSENTIIALHTMALLAEQPHRWFTNREICEILHCSPHTLAKVLQLLGKQGLIVSERGPNGGSKLAINPREIYLHQIIQLFEGPMIPGHRCLLGTGLCRQDSCILGKLVNHIQCLISQTFSQTTLNELADTMKLGGSLYVNS